LRILSTPMKVAVMLGLLAVAMVINIVRLLLLSILGIQITN